MCVQKQLKLMVADDHAAFRQVVKTVLEPLAAEFLECQDGQEAADRYAQTRPDVVLMDIAMEPMDGLRATALIKTRFPAARIIVLTQFDEAELRAAARNAGACAYLVKEELPRLQQVIESLLDQKLETPCSPESTA